MGLAQKPARRPLQQARAQPQEWQQVQPQQQGPAAVALLAPVLVPAPVRAVEE